MRTFYNLGMICFTMIALSNLWSLGHQWDMLDLGQRTSQIFSIIFDFGLALFFKSLKDETLPKKLFKYLENSSSPSQDTTISADEMLEALKKVDIATKDKTERRKKEI